MKTTVKSCGIALAALLALFLAACGQPTSGGTKSPDPVTIAVVPGVTPPAMGEDPVTAIAPTSQYTGTVSWEPAVDVDAGFAAKIQYTAVITLTEKAGYTLAGVRANYFTVAGAAATNDANSGVIRADFPATGDTPPEPVTIAAITGVNVPVTGGVPVTAITPTEEYTGAVSWEPTVDTVFAADTVYTAVIYLTPKPGYTFRGVPLGFFTVGGAEANSVSSAVVSARFPATAPAPGANPYAGEWVWEGGPTQNEPQPVKITLRSDNTFVWQQEFDTGSGFRNIVMGGYQRTGNTINFTITHAASPLGSSNWSDLAAEIAAIVNSMFGGNEQFSSTVSGSAVGSSLTIPGPGGTTMVFEKTADEPSGPYDGTVYELSIGTVHGEPAWIAGPVVTGIPSGTIYDKNDLGWDDNRAGDRAYWIETGLVDNSKVIIELPETVSDDILREEAGGWFGWFGNWEVNADWRFTLMCLEGDYAGDALFYYAKNAAPNHDVDGVPVDLGQGWNFLIMPLEGEGRLKAESLADLYQKGFRWYLEPASSGDFAVPGIYEATIEGHALSLCLNGDGSFFALGASNPTPTGTYTVNGMAIQLNFVFNSPGPAQWNGTVSQAGLDFGDVTYTRKTGGAPSPYAGTWANWQNAVRMLVAGDLTMTLELYTGGEEYSEDDWGIIAKGFLDISGPGVSFNLTDAWNPGAGAWTSNSAEMSTLLPNWHGVYVDDTGTINGRDMGSVMQLSVMNNISLTKQPPDGGISGGPSLPAAPLGDTITIESERVYSMSGAAETFNAELSGVLVSGAPYPLAWEEVFEGPRAVKVEGGLLSMSIGAPRAGTGFDTVLQMFGGAIPGTIEVSDTSARFFGFHGVRVLPSEYNGEPPNTHLDLQLGQREGDRTTKNASYAWVDRDVTIKGTHQAEGSVNTTIYNLNLKKGWNSLVMIADLENRVGTASTTMPPSEYKWAVRWAGIPNIPPEGNSLTITGFPFGEGETVTVYTGTDSSGPESLAAVGTGVVTGGSVGVRLFIPSSDPFIPSSDPWTDTGDYFIFFTMSGTNGFLYGYTAGQTPDPSVPPENQDLSWIPRYPFTGNPAQLPFSDFYFRAGDGRQFGTASPDGSLTANIPVSGVDPSLGGTIVMVNDNASPPVNIAEVGTLANGIASIALPAELPDSADNFVDGINDGDNGLSVTPSHADYLHRYTFYVYSGDAVLGYLSIGNAAGVSLNYWYFLSPAIITGQSCKVYARKGWNLVLLGGSDVSPTTNMGDDPGNLVMSFSRGSPGEQYDGTVYELSFDEVTETYIPGAAAAGIPTGPVYDKNDLGWDDNWIIDRSRWIETGSVADNKVTLTLPAVPDAILQEEGGNLFGWFDNWEVNTAYGFKLACFAEDSGAGGAVFYYAKEAQPNYDLYGQTVNLDRGWNFLVMPFEGEGCWKAASLDDLYQRGFRWYLVPGGSEDALSKLGLPAGWQSLDGAGWDEWARGAGGATLDQYARLVSFMRYPVNNAALSPEGKGFWDEIIAMYDFDAQNQTLPAPEASPVASDHPLFQDSQVYSKARYYARVDWEESCDPLYPSYEPEFTPVTDLGEVSGGKLSIALPAAPASFAYLAQVFPNGYTMSDTSAEIQFLGSLHDYNVIPTGSRIWLWDCYETIPVRLIEFVYSSAATTFKGTDFEGDVYNLVLVEGWNTIIRYMEGDTKHFISQPIPGTADWIYGRK